MNIRNICTNYVYFLSNIFITTHVLKAGMIYLIILTVLVISTLKIIIILSVKKLIKKSIYNIV